MEVVLWGFPEARNSLQPCWCKGIASGYIGYVAS